MSEATQKMSLSSSGKENSVKDDALVTPAPVYKQLSSFIFFYFLDFFIFQKRLLQAYAEEHAIQDLLYYLADGLRRESIGLDTYLKVCCFCFIYLFIFIFLFVVACKRTFSKTIYLTSNNA